MTETANQVIASTPELIVPKVECILAGDAPQGRVSGLWDGKAARRIVKDLELWRE